VSGFLTAHQHISISSSDILLLILMKMNLKQQDMAWRFHISCTKVSELINKGTPQIFEKVKFLNDYQPLMDSIRDSMRDLVDRLLTAMALTSGRLQHGQHQHPAASPGTRPGGQQTCPHSPLPRAMQPWNTGCYGSQRANGPPRHMGCCTCCTSSLA